MLRDHHKVDVIGHETVSPDITPAFGFAAAINSKPASGCSSNNYIPLQAKVINEPKPELATIIAKNY